MSKSEETKTVPRCFARGTGRTDLPLTKTGRVVGGWGLVGDEKSLGDTSFWRCHLDICKDIVGTQDGVRETSGQEIQIQKLLKLRRHPISMYSLLPSTMHLIFLQKYYIIRQCREGDPASDLWQFYTLCGKNYKNDSPQSVQCFSSLYIYFYSPSILKTLGRSQF